MGQRDSMDWKVIRQLRMYSRFCRSSTQSERTQKHSRRSHSDMISRAGFHAWCDMLLGLIRFLKIEKEGLHSEIHRRARDAPCGNRVGLSRDSIRPWSCNWRCEVPDLGSECHQPITRGEGVVTTKYGWTSGARCSLCIHAQVHRCRCTSFTYALNRSIHSSNAISFWQIRRPYGSSSQCCFHTSWYNV